MLFKLSQQKVNTGLILNIIIAKVKKGTHSTSKIRTNSPSEVFSRYWILRFRWRLAAFPSNLAIGSKFSFSDI